MGLVQAVVGRNRLEAMTPDGVFFFVAKRGGWTDRFCRRYGVSAYTWGAVITYARVEGTRDARLVAHERAHVKQAMRWGVLMPVLYGLSSLQQWVQGKRPYADNAFEVAARRAENPTTDRL